jgi:hypothetical protein
MPQTKATHKQAGGHIFNRVTDTCDRCGRSRADYNDSGGKLKCIPREGKREAMSIDD